MECIDKNKMIEVLNHRYDKKRIGGVSQFTNMC